MTLSVEKECEQLTFGLLEAPFFGAEPERCTECGYDWSDEGPIHSNDCRYYLLDEGDDKDMSFAGSIAAEALKQKG
jgi:hypothetical protein